MYSSQQSEPYKGECVQSEQLKVKAHLPGQHIFCSLAAYVIYLSLKDKERARQGHTKVI